MSSVLELQEAKVIIGQSGQIGTKGIFPIDDNKIVTVVDMQVGAYIIAAQPTVPCLLSVKVTAVGTADTMGTITFVGTDINGVAITEEVIPVAGSTIYTTKEFASVTSATGAGWVIDGVEGTEDTVIIGVDSIIAPTGYYFCTVHFITESVVAAQTALTGFTVVDLTKFTAIPADRLISTKLTKISLTSGSAIGFLQII